jgi:Stigma-specific protein, Stig1
MDEKEKKSGAGTISGGPQIKIVIAIIAIAAVILAAVLVAKFGFGADLLNPSGGQMSLVQRPNRGVVPPITVTVVPTTKNLGITMVTSIRPNITMRNPTLCPEGQSGCSGTCVDLNSDNGNCGSCGNVCPSGKPCTYGRCCASPVGDPRNCGGVSCFVAQYNIYAPCGEENCEPRCLEINPWDADCSLTTGSQHVNIYSDVNNCGGCGFKCAAGQTCDRFTCK